LLGEESTVEVNPPVGLATLKKRKKKADPVGIGLLKEGDDA